MTASKEKRICEEKLYIEQTGPEDGYLGKDIGW